MKTIILKKLILLNFKGIRKLTIDFSEKETGIRGANGSGKTTIADAWNWLLFGKNSQGETNFGIKTLDKDNNVIPQIDHEVEAFITVDGEEICLKRTFREKWVKKRGSLEAEFGGNETEFHWNDVPMTLRDYTSKISSIVEEKVFKLITSPAAFNSLSWQEQRQALIDITGGVTDADVAQGNPDYEKLLSKLTSKSLEEYQKQIASSIRKAKDEIKAIPTRIDEVERGKPKAIDFLQLEKELAAKQKELQEVDGKITDRLKAQQDVIDKRAKIKTEIQKIEFQISDIKHKATLTAKEQIRNASSISDSLNAQISEKNEELSKARRTLESIDCSMEDYKDQIQELAAKNDEIRSEWNKLNSQTFKMDENDCKCPTCKREFEAEDIEAKKKELQDNFQKNKIESLNALTASGKKNAALIADAEKEIEALEARKEKGTAIIEKFVEELEDLSKGLETAQDNSTDIKTEAEIVAELLEGNEEIEAANKKIEELSAQLEKQEGVNMDDLKEQKTALSKDFESLKSQLQAKVQIDQANKRIEDLQEEESKLAQQIADYEKDQFIIEEFTKAKMDTLEGKINERFSYVKFKLFESQVNGGEIPTCKALINGVPFSDANTASRVNAGIDIINTLCDHYGVQAPVFCDNRESVTEILPTQSQIINLIVDPSKKKLEVKTPAMAELF